MKVVSMRGVALDMGALAAKNEKVVALGNASMNARGDIVGPGGKVVKKREQVATEYYAANPKAVKQVALRDLSSEAFVTPDQVFAKHAEVAPATEANAAATAPAPAKKRKIEDRED